MSPPVRFDFRGYLPPDEELQPVVEHLRRGGAVVLPTETGYGLACRAVEDVLVGIGGRGPGAAGGFVLLVPSVRSVRGLAWSREARDLAEVFWPGSLTLVLRDPEGTFPPDLRREDGSVLVRRSSHPIASRLVEAVGEPLACLGLDVGGEGASASRHEDAFSAVSGVGAREDVWVLEAGGLPESAPATIVDCTEGVPRVLRAGVTPPARLRCVLPQIAPE